MCKELVFGIIWSSDSRRTSWQPDLGFSVSVVTILHSLVYRDLKRSSLLK